jgi:AcrR family transcriptional regulator
MVATAGRRPGPTRTKDAILAAARAQFASRGYTSTTLRSVARAAGVHPALIHHHFGSKEQLYDAALSLPVDPIETLTRLTQVPRDQFPEALVRHFIATWRDAQAGLVLHALLRRAISDPDQTALLRSHAETVLVPRIATALGIPQVNVAAAFAQLIGLTIADTFIRIGPLTRATEDQIVALATPAISRCLEIS